MQRLAKTGEPFVRLYRFMKADRAIAVIKNAEMRVTRRHELNDPFEFLPAIVTHSDGPEDENLDTIDYLMPGFERKCGLLCFSEKKTITEPLMWSHYADCHRGIALGFDFTITDDLRRVLYRKKRPTINSLEYFRMSQQQRKDVWEQAACTKSVTWRYERERRFFMKLKACRKEGTHHFAHLNTEDFLKHVVLGIHCAYSIAEVQAVLGRSKFRDVRVSQAQISRSAFKVETD